MSDIKHCPVCDTALMRVELQDAVKREERKMGTNRTALITCGKPGCTYYRYGSEQHPWGIEE